MLKNNHFLFSLKIVFIGIISILPRFNQNGMQYVYIYGLFSLIYCIQLVLATLAFCVGYI